MIDNLIFEWMDKYRNVSDNEAKIIKFLVKNDNTFKGSWNEFAEEIDILAENLRKNVKSMQDKGFVKIFYEDNSLKHKKLNFVVLVENWEEFL
jgi:predicted transcriptional regulator